MTVDVIRALPVVTTARVLIQLEWHRRRLHTIVVLRPALDLCARGPGRQPNRDRQIFEVDRFACTEIPITAGMLCPARISDRQINFYSWRTGKKMELGLDLQGRFAARAADLAFGNDDAAQRTVFDNTNGSDRRGRAHTAIVYERECGAIEQQVITGVQPKSRRSRS